MFACGENKETLALLAPPPITHAASTPSSQLSQLQKLYKYTRTHSCIIHTHPQARHFFLLTPFPAQHGPLQLVLVCPLSARSLYGECVWVHVCICVCVCRVLLSQFQLTWGAHLWFCGARNKKKKERKFASSFYPLLGCEILEARLKQNLLLIWERDVSFLTNFAPLCSKMIRLADSTWWSVCEIAALLTLHVLGVYEGVGANASFFDSNAICEVVNLITRATKSSDTVACRKHLGLARIYGLGGSSITQASLVNAPIIRLPKNGRLASLQVETKSASRNTDDFLIKFNLQGRYPNKTTEVRSRYLGGQLGSWFWLFLVCRGFFSILLLWLKLLWLDILKSPVRLRYI